MMRWANLKENRRITCYADLITSLNGNSLLNRGHNMRWGASEYWWRIAPSLYNVFKILSYAQRLKIYLRLLVFLFELYGLVTLIIYMFSSGFIGTSYANTVCDIYWYVIFFTCTLVILTGVLYGSKTWFKILTSLHHPKWGTKNLGNLWTDKVEIRVILPLFSTSSNLINTRRPMNGDDVKHTIL